jgi:hypothetical protein
MDNREEENMDDKAENLDETAALDSLKPNSMPADGMTKSDMLSNLVGAMNGMKKSELVDFFNKSMAQFGPNADLGIPDGTSQRNATTIVPKGSPVQEDVNEMFSGTELSEDFKDKISTLIESAVNVRTNLTIAQLQEENEINFNELVEEYKEELSESIDHYLSFAVNEWIEENKVAVETSIKNELQSSFMTGLHNLFKEHYIDIPEDKLDLLGQLESEIEELKQSFNDIQNKNIELSSTNEELNCQLVITAATRDLTESDALRFMDLIDGITYTDMKNYETKLNTIKESHFSNKAEIVKEQEEVMGIDSLNENAADEPVITGPMSKYLETVAKTTKKYI